MSWTYASGSLPNTWSLCAIGSLSGLVQWSTWRTWICLWSWWGNASCDLNISTWTNALLQIVKTVNRTTASIGDVVIRTILYQNNSTGVLYNTTIMDIIPSIFTVTTIQSILGINTGYTTGLDGYIFTIGALSWNTSGTIVLSSIVNTGAATGVTYINTASWTASGVTTVYSTAFVAIHEPYVFTLPSWWPYIPVPLPESPIKTPPPVTFAPQVSIVYKTRMLRVIQEYMPFYTQPIEAITNNIKKIPDTGAWTWLSIVLSYIRRLFDL